MRRRRAAADKPLRIYIAGPMSGLPGMNLEAFHEAKRRLEAAGYIVSSPADRGIGAGTWEHYMRQDLADLMECDAIAYLPNWDQSRGAYIEVTLGGILEMPIRSVDEWVALRLEEVR